MTDRRQTYCEGSRFEELAAYSRAVRVGAHVSVSGTAPIDAGGLVHLDHAYGQTLFALRKAMAATAALGAGPEDVLRTRLLLAPGADWEGAVRAHGEVLADVRPANTTYFVGGFVPDVLVEVELDAVVAHTT